MIELSTALFLGYVFHRVGDYMFQNHWMATEKTKNFHPALIHALLYSVLFLLIVSWEWWLVIFITHFFIDRYRLAAYWTRLVSSRFVSHPDLRFEGEWKFGDAENFGYGKDTPKWLSVWLLINVDNTIHLVINTLCIIGSYG